VFFLLRLVFNIYQLLVWNYVHIATIVWQILPFSNLRHLLVIAHRSCGIFYDSLQLACFLRNVIMFVLSTFVDEGDSIGNETLSSLLALDHKLGTYID
jgi:hypothetical protein